jgi:hypothetical protein
MPRGVPKNGYPKNRKSRPCPEETRQKISAALSGRSLSPEHKAALGGQSLSPEHKAALAAVWTPEKRQRLRDLNADLWTAEKRQEHSEQMRRERRPAAAGSTIDKDGYRILTMQQGHPLATPNGGLAEHRKVLYAKIGSGEHQCNWCGRAIRWRAEMRREDICVDHLDEDKLNNEPENLVPSCFQCNWDRQNPKRKDIF